MSCPICSKPTDATYRPCCSKRCADVDLAKWFYGAYATPSQDPEDIEKAIDALIEELNERWKRIAAVASDDMLELQAKLSFANFATWQRQLARLNEANLIRQMAIVELTAQYAYVRFSYIGSIEQLSNNLYQAGLQLLQTEDGWQLNENQEY